MARTEIQAAAQSSRPPDVSKAPQSTWSSANKAKAALAVVVIIACSIWVGLEIFGRSGPVESPPTQNVVVGVNRALANEDRKFEFVTVEPAAEGAGDSVVIGGHVASKALLDELSSRLAEAGLTDKVQVQVKVQP